MKPPDESRWQGPPIDSTGDDGDDEAMPDPITRPELDARIDATEATVKTIVADMRSDLHKLSSDISRWTLQTVLAVIATMVVGLGGLFWNVANGFRELRDRPPPSIASTSPAPTIIYVTPPSSAQQQPAPAAAIPAHP